MTMMNDVEMQAVDKSACFNCGILYHTPFSEISNQACKSCGKREWVRVVKASGPVQYPNGDVWFRAAVPTCKMVGA